MKHLILLLLASTILCSSPALPVTNLVFEEQWAVAYSGFRKGQHPDRGFGAKTQLMNKP